MYDSDVEGACSTRKMALLFDPHAATDESFENESMMEPLSPTTIFRCGEDDQDIRATFLKRANPIAEQRDEMMDETHEIVERELAESAPSEIRLEYQPEQQFSMFFDVGADMAHMDCDEFSYQSEVDDLGLDVISADPFSFWDDGIGAVQSAERSASPTEVSVESGALAPSQDADDLIL